jgi:hypothetical protein
MRAFELFPRQRRSSRHCLHRTAIGRSCTIRFTVRAKMTRSFRDPNGRIPNFGIAGAMPNPLPWWADPDHWRIVPPLTPPWSAPPPQDFPDTFGVPPQMPAPLRPRSDERQASAASDLLDLLFGRRRADPDWSARRLPPAADIDGPVRDLVDRHEWEPIEPKLGLKPLPFDSRQLDMLRQLRPDELLRLTGDKSSPGRAVQPPIFFPFD